MNLTPHIEAILPHLGTIVGFGLAFILIARLLREKRRPGNTFAWLILIALAPYVGVPLFLLFGGRKIAKLTKGKGPIDIRGHVEGDRSASPFGLRADGNRTRFLKTGVEAYDALIDSIRGARSSIEITTFILSHDSVGRRVVKELAARAKAGVQVRLLVDAVGSFGRKAFYILELEKAGGRIERFMPVFPIAFPGAANLRNHRKIAIFDRRSAIIGGRNIGKDYMGPARPKGYWMDLGAQIEGPAVAALATIFEADWKFASRRKEPDPQILPPPLAELQVPGGSSIEIIASGPDTTGDPLYEKTLSVIHEAELSVTIVTPYFIPDEVLLRSLVVKARSGKTVTVIVPKRSNHPITDYARRHALRELRLAGVNVLYFGPGMLHGKALLVDRSVAMTGSANLDLRSLFFNYEVTATFYGEEDVESVAKWMDALSAQCEPMPAAELKPRGILNGATEDVCRLLAPLL